MLKKLIVMILVLKNGLLMAQDQLNSFELDSGMNHSNIIDAIQVSNDESIIVTAEDYLVKVWDTKKRKELKFKNDYAFHNIKSIDITGDNKLVAFGGKNGIGIWDIAENKIIHHSYHFDADAKVLFLNENKLMGLSTSGSFYLVDVLSGNLVKSLSLEKENPNCGSFETFIVNHLKKTILFSTENEIIEYDLENFKRIKSIAFKTKRFSNFQLSKDEESLFVMDENSNFCVFSANSLKLIKDFKLYDNLGYTNFYVWDKYLIFKNSSFDRKYSLNVWDIEFAKEINQIDVSPYGTTNIRYLESEKLLVAAGLDGTLKEWIIDDFNKPIENITNLPIVKATFNSSGNKFAIGYLDGKVEQISIDGLEKKQITANQGLSMYYPILFDNKDENIYILENDHGLLKWDLSIKTDSISFDPIYMGTSNLFITKNASSFLIKKNYKMKFSKEEKSEYYPGIVAFEDYVNSSKIIYLKNKKTFISYVEGENYIRLHDNNFMVFDSIKCPKLYRIEFVISKDEQNLIIHSKVGSHLEATNNISIIDIDKKIFKTFSTSIYFPKTLALSTNSKYLCISHSAGIIDVWDLELKINLKQLRINNSPLAIRFSDDSKALKIVTNKYYVELKINLDKK